MRAQRIVCPYHGWTYALDGRLIGVPKIDGFMGSIRSSRARRRAHRVLGRIRVDHIRCARRCAAGISRDAGHEQLEPYRLAEMRPLLRRSWTLPCNWKAVLDQATESYHLRVVHGRSIGQVIDTTSTFYGLGPHHLQTIPIADYRWRPWLDRMSVPADLPCTADQLRLFHKYMIFPNTLINVMPYHLTVFPVFPITPDSCRFQYEFHVRERAGTLGRCAAGSRCWRPSTSCARICGCSDVPVRGSERRHGPHLFSSRRASTRRIFIAMVDRYE